MPWRSPVKIKYGVSFSTTFTGQSIVCHTNCLGLLCGKGLDGIFNLWPHIIIGTVCLYAKNVITQTSYLSKWSKECIKNLKTSKTGWIMINRYELSLHVHGTLNCVDILWKLKALDYCTLNMNILSERNKWVYLYVGKICPWNCL